MIRLARLPLAALEAALLAAAGVVHELNWRVLR